MADDPIPAPEPDPEPEGALDIDVQGQKQKMVPVAALVAERQRIRHADEEKHAKELEPLKAKAAQADQLAADLAAIQPHIEHLRQHPELMAREQPPELQAVSDADAERMARQYELYTATGLDLPRAKRIIADNRAEMRAVAQQAAAEAVQPVAETGYAQSSRQNFLWAASQQGPDGRPAVDFNVLAQEWAKLPTELTAKPQVAQWILRAAIGEAALTGKRPPAGPDREPVFSEPPGGGGSAYSMSDFERKVAQSAGVTEKEWTTRAKAFRPGDINVLGGE